MPEETRLLQLTLTERKAELLSGALAIALNYPVLDDCGIALFYGLPCADHELEAASKMPVRDILQAKIETAAYCREFAKLFADFCSDYRRGKYPLASDPNRKEGGE